MSWYANQHLIIKIDLPVSYMDLEVGDYIKYSDLLGDKLAFGYDYTLPQTKNGQYIYDIFFITSINKSLNKISVESIQVHRGEYGIPDDNLIGEQEGSLDGGGNNGQGNFDLGDPSDNPNYNEENIADEFIDEETPPPFFNFYWEQNLNNINTNVLAANVSTNLSEDWNYDIFIMQCYTSSGNPIVFPEGSNIPDLNNGNYTEENSPIATNMINHNKIVSNLAENYNGKIELTKKYDFLLDDEDDEIFVTFMIKVFNNNNIKYLTFTQNGFFLDLSLDVTGDNAVNILDVVTLLGSIINHTENELPENADFNEDGTINVQDILILLNYILGN